MKLHSSHIHLLGLGLFPASTQGASWLSSLRNAKHNNNDSASHFRKLGDFQPNGDFGTLSGGNRPPPTMRPAPAPGLALPAGCEPNPEELTNHGLYLLMDTDTSKNIKIINDGQRFDASGSGGFRLEQNECLLQLKDPKGEVLWERGDKDKKDCSTNIQGDWHLVMGNSDGKV